MYSPQYMGTIQSSESFQPNKTRVAQKGEIGAWKIYPRSHNGLWGGRSRAPGCLGMDPSAQSGGTRPGVASSPAPLAWGRGPPCSCTREQSPRKAESVAKHQHQRIPSTMLCTKIRYLKTRHIGLSAVWAILCSSFSTVLVKFLRAGAWIMPASLIIN